MLHETDGKAGEEEGKWSYEMGPVNLLQCDKKTREDEDSSARWPQQPIKPNQAQPQ